jgi:hypothetical protein
MAGQSSPSTPDVEKRFTLLEHELVADQLEFIVLCFFKRTIRRRRLEVAFVTIRSKLRHLISNTLAAH